MSSPPGGKAFLQADLFLNGEDTKNKSYVNSENPDEISPTVRHSGIANAPVPKKISAFKLACTRGELGDDYGTSWKEERDQSETSLRPLSPSCQRFSNHAFVPGYFSPHDLRAVYFLAALCCGAFPGVFVVIAVLFPSTLPDVCPRGF